MAITEKKLDDWAKKHDLKKLHKALLEYDYKTRLKAISHLAKLKNRESLPHLEALIEDAFLVILKETAEAIRSITPNHPSIAVFEEKILEKENLEEKRKARTEASFVPPTEVEEQEKLKQMAKDYDVMKIYQQGLREEKKQIKSRGLATTIAAAAGGIAILLYLLYLAL